MSDERLFIHVCAGCGAQMTHARPCAPGCGSIEAESIEVVEAAALARVKRERDEAREHLHDASNALLVEESRADRAEVERDALRAQVKALGVGRAELAADAAFLISAHASKESIAYPHLEKIRKRVAVARDAPAEAGA
jgi:hypothetical protein